MSSNPAYIYDNRIQTLLGAATPVGSVTSSTEDAVYPLANLYDGIYAKPFRFTVTTGGWIEFDFASAQPFDEVVVLGHNMASLTGATVKAGSSANPSTTVGNLVYREQDVRVDTGTQSARHVRITLPATGTANTQIGELVIGTRVELPRPYQWGIEPEDINEGVDLVTNGGVDWTYEYFSKYGLDIPFRFPESERAALRLFNERVARNPFVLIPYPVEPHAYYGRKQRGFKPKPLGAYDDEGAFGLWYDWMMSFKTESLGLAVNI